MSKQPIYIDATRTHILNDGLQPRTGHLWRDQRTLCGLVYTVDDVTKIRPPSKDLCKTCSKIFTKLCVMTALILLLPV